MTATATAVLDTAPVSAPWKGLAWVMSRANYGDTLQHGSIGGILGAEYPSRSYYASVKTAIDEQQQRKRHWRLVPQIGYQLLFPHEIHRLSADQVGKAKAATQRGAVALQRRDTPALPRLIDKSYASAEAALLAMTELLASVEKEMRVTGKPARFDALKDVATRALADWRANLDADRQIANGHRKGKSEQQWRPFRCQCGTVLVRFQGVSSKHGRKALLMTCGRCANKNALFGVSDDTAIEVCNSNVIGMADA